MPDTSDIFQNTRGVFQEFGQVFKERPDTQLISSFSSRTEEEYTPDPEQLREDELLGDAYEETDILWAREAESSPSATFKRDFRGDSCKFKPTYFVDGSVRTVKALDGVEGDYVFPIVIGQVGAASVKRCLRTPVKHQIKTKVVLLIPLSGLSGTLKTYLTNQLQGSLLQNDTFVMNDILVQRGEHPSLKTGEEKDYAKLRLHASRRAKHLMMEVELQVLKDCVSELSDKIELIILDGTLLEILKSKSICENKLHSVIGVSKSFSTRPLRLIGEHLNRSDCTSQVFQLKEGERTDAIELQIDPTWVVTWYQRIRPRARVESPLDGIVKVETHFADYPAYKSKNESRQFSKDWSKVWDEIASAVYAERFPIPFHEQRWHALLYPVYCCEKILKSSFFSIEVMRGLCAGIIR